MKKLFLAPALAALLLVSCKDDPKLEAPEISSIELSKEKVAVGQLIILTPTVTDKDTDNANLLFEWRSTDGLSSNESEAKWVPNATGNQVITLTVDDGTSRATQETKVDVVEPNFRRGLWSDLVEDVVMSEEYAGNKMETIPVASGINALVLLSDIQNALDAYIFENDKLVQAETIFTNNYSIAQYEQYFTNFNTQSTRLVAEYGSAKETMTEWATAADKVTYANKPDQWGKALAEGALVSHATLWETDATNIILYVEIGDEGEVYSGIFYYPTDDGRLSDAKRQLNMLSEFRTYSKKLRNR